MGATHTVEKTSSRFMCSRQSIVVACLLTDVSLGLINRFASQLNVYVLAMPIKSGVAAFLMLFYFMMLLSNATGLFDGVKADFEQLRRLLP